MRDWTPWSRSIWSYRAATDYWDDSFIAGAFTVPGTDGEWTLVFDFNGGVGMSRFMPSLSQNGRAVSHSTNGGAPIDLFDWFEDGELRTGFEWPTNRYGGTPDELVPMMREIGFDLTEDEDDTGRAPTPRRRCLPSPSV